jgi:PQ loop repeat
LLVNTGRQFYTVSAIKANSSLTYHQKLIPQIIINYQRHDTTGLQPLMMILWAYAGVPLGVYNIVEEFNIALRIQPQILTLLSLVTWAQCCYYSKVLSSPIYCFLASCFICLPYLYVTQSMYIQHWSILHSIAYLFLLATAMGLVQASLIFALRAAKSKNLNWPLILMAALAATLLAAGVLRHYVDIYMHRAVRGISFLFVGIDAAGDLFSLASVFFQPKLDVLGIVIYGTEFVLWVGIMVAGGYYNMLPWVRLKLKGYRSRDR